MKVQAVHARRVLIGVFRGYRIAVNVIAAICIVLLLVNPARDLTPICLLLVVVVGLWFGSVAWRRIAGRTN